MRTAPPDPVTRSASRTGGEVHGNVPADLAIVTQGANMAREYRFPVEIAWDGGRRTTARVGGKQPLDIATPPEFRGTDPDLWSPEDVFVAAAGSCLAVTIAALADGQQLPLRNLDVHAEGVVSRRPDGRFGFVKIEQTVELETDAEHEGAARALITKAEESCLVSVSLALPIETTVHVRTLLEAPGA